MSSATLTRPRTARRAVTPDDGWRPTLDEMLVGVWEGLHLHDETGCPVCGGAMVAQAQTGRPPVAGHCRDCGSTLI